MIFTWQYQGNTPRKLRSVFKSFGVTSSLMKIAIFHGGAMFIDGASAWAVDLVQPGQQVGLLLPDEPANPNITLCDEPFKIAFEDEDFLVINKDAGVATVPAHHVAVQDSLVNRVKSYYIHQGYDNQVTHVATRLDKNTSGLVVFPKHRFAHAVLDKQLKHHQVYKEYLAVVGGRAVNTSHGYIYAPIERDPSSFVQRRVNCNGKESVTEYWTLYRSNQGSIEKINLHTGRTHQIRVHFSFLGHPLLGDDMYGGDLSLINRQALHCQTVSFYSPFKNEQIVCHAALPDDMENLINHIK